MELRVEPAAQRALRTIPRATAESIMRRMQAVAADPFGNHPQAKKLAGKAGYRLRVGDWRALYVIDREAGQVVLEDVKNRREAYR